MKTIWLRIPVIQKSGLAFLATATLEFGLAGVKYLITKKPFRTVKYVKESYDLERNELLISFLESPPDIDIYIYGLPNKKDFILANNRVFYDSIRAARMRCMSFILEKLRYDLDDSAKTVIEFGCGDGRNLICLKKCFPNIRFIGYELSNKSVELCRAAAKHYNLDIEFKQVDVTSANKSELMSADICFSVHALEQIPRGYDKALTLMHSLAINAVYLFEPIHELYSFSLRGVLSRIRVRVFDRVSGLYNYAKKLPAKEFFAESLGFSDNPLNETCFVKIVK
jgi:hypothetical protein